MATENRRIAAYLPLDVHQRLEVFKSEQGIKSDSQAIIEILTKFLEVSYPIAQEVPYSDFVALAQRTEVLESQVSILKSELLHELKGELLESNQILISRLNMLEAKVNSFEQMKYEVKDELLGELMSELPATTETSGQLTLIPNQVKDSVIEGSGGLLSQPDGSHPEVVLQPLNGYALADRLGVAKDTVGGTRRKLSSERFIEWTKKKDPGAIGWEYRESTKLYHPISSS